MATMIPRLAAFVAIALLASSPATPQRVTVGPGLTSVSGMLPTAANAVLPDARTNLGLGTASTPTFAGISLGGGPFVSSSSGYTGLKDGSGGPDAIIFGPTGAATNYYDQATHMFRGQSGTGTPHLSVSQTTAPVLTSCGTGSPTIVGTDVAGTVTTGTSATGCVITFTAAYGATPHCTVTWQSTPAASQSYTVAAGAITLTQTSASGRVVNYACIGQ